MDAARDDDGFETLALELFAYQYEKNEAYQRLCEAFGRGPDSVYGWRDIPPVPTGAFKEVRLATFPAENDVCTFRTSGSSSTGRGELHLDSLALYEASLLQTFDAFICLGERLRFAVLAPPARELPDSSLSYMFATVVRKLGAEGSRCYAHAEGWEPEALRDDVSALEEPVAMVGTAFAFVHLIDALEDMGIRLQLPDGSRVMETGGFKGRSRELTREALHGGIAAALDVAPERIVNQYGMSELGSQFYEDSLRTGRPSRAKRVPPWVRTRVVDPGTLEDVPEGERGVLIHYDLANTGSVLAVQTSDLGRLTPDGFEVLGRVAGAEARGCSLAADLLFGRGS